jgi:hypothetical protein
MKFKLVKKVEGKVNCYGLGEFATGEIVNIPDENKALIEKALLNKSYELVQEAVKSGK